MINKKNKLYFKMKKDKKYKEKYKQLKHQVQKEQRHAYNTYIEKLILNLPTLFLNKFHISFTVLFASLFMFIIFLSVSSKSNLMLSQFALSYLRIFLGCWRTLRSHMSASM
jgi:hypothetical protein